MSLRHALLGLLTAGPMSGYDLGKVFDRSVAYVWHAPHSQIYPELRRMEADGMIEAVPFRRGKRGIKRVYSITPAGRGELERWITQPLTPEPTRDSARLKTTYLEFVSYEEARRHYEAHIAHYERWESLWRQHAANLAARDTPLLRRRLATPGIGNPEAIVGYKVHAYDGLIRLAHEEAEWGRAGLELVDRLEAEQSGAPTGEGDQAAGQGTL